MKSKGGKRKGAGRKPVLDKKQAVTIYVRKSEIKRKGGLNQLKNLLSEII